MRHLTQFMRPRRPPPFFLAPADAMSAFDEQEGGHHYRCLHIQPALYCEKNHLSHLESSVVERVSRHRHPSGKGLKDIEMAIQDLRMLVEIFYKQGGAVLQVHYRDGGIVPPN